MSFLPSLFLVLFSSVNSVNSALWFSFYIRHDWLVVDYWCCPSQNDDVVNEFDDAGEVFGRPDQVELDLIIRNGQLLIAEIKSSINRGEMYLFERKARFYEKKHQRTAQRQLNGSAAWGVA